MIVRVRRELDRSLRGAVCQGIADEIGRNLLDAAQITPHGMCHVDVRDDLAIGLTVLEFSDDLFETRVDVRDLIHVHADSPAEFAASKIQDVIDERRHAFGIAADSIRQILDRSRVARFAMY